MGVVPRHRAAARAGLLTRSLSTSAQSVAWPRPWRAWTAIVILMLAYVVGFVDRQVLSLLVVPIKADLGLSETQLGLLQGFAFGTFYTLLGLPIARLVDRSSRTPLLAGGIALWSLMTAACGLSRNFVELLLARIGVGVGEATLAPSAVSLIGDLFPPGRRALALSVYIAAGSMGGGLAFLLGAAAIDWATRWDRAGLWLLEDMAPWQVVFVLVGLPGVFVSLLVLAIGEPERREVSDTHGDDSLMSVPFRRLLAAQRTLFLWHFLGFGLFSIVSYGVLSWVAAHFIREFGWTPARFGYAFGWAFLVAGAGGAVIGGSVATRLRARRWRAADLTTAAIGVTMAVPLTLAACLVGRAEPALALFAASLFFMAFPSGPSVAAFQEVTPNEFRGRVSALYYLCINLIGLGFGALAVGLVSDIVLSTDQQVGLSMAIVTATFGPASIVALWMARRARLVVADQ